MENKANIVIGLAVLALAVAVFFSGDTILVKTIDGDPVTVQTDTLGAMAGDETYNEVGFLGGMRYTEKVATIAKTNIYATTTLNLKDSGTNYMVSASGTTITLPSVKAKGTHYRFTVGGALDTGNVMVTSAEGDNIDGTLIVAGAVVDCDAVDAINFIVDGENVGDFFEIVSNGTKWLLLGSGTLTSGKMTCTG